MKTLSLRGMAKQNQSKWPQAEPSTLQRLGNFLLRDLLPSVLMVITVSMCALFIGQKIDQAKSSSVERMVEVRSNP
jgi:hypothetical protein